MDQSKAIMIYLISPIHPTLLQMLNELPKKKKTKGPSL